jgi:hypothetical protein
MFTSFTDLRAIFPERSRVPLQREKTATAQ